MDTNDSRAPRAGSSIWVLTFGDRSIIAAYTSMDRAKKASESYLTYTYIEEVSLDA